MADEVSCADALPVRTSCSMIDIIIFKEDGDLWLMRGRAYIYRVSSLMTCCGKNGDTDIYIMATHVGHYPPRMDACVKNTSCNCDMSFEIAHGLNFACLSTNLASEFIVAEHALSSLSKALPRELGILL